MAASLPMTLVQACVLLEAGMEEGRDKVRPSAHYSPEAAYDYAAMHGRAIFGAPHRRKNEDEVLLVGFLDLAASRADNLDRPEVSSVLWALIQSIITHRPRSLEILNAAAVRATRLHDALQGVAVPPDVETIVTTEISRPGQPPGVDALALARRLSEWLKQLNPDVNSDVHFRLHEDGLFTSEAERDEVFAAFPSRLVIGGRVFVRADEPHREGASPRKREALCRCARCSAKHLMRAAERVMGNGMRMSFPKPRKRRGSK